MAVRGPVVCSRCLKLDAKVIGVIDPNSGGALCAPCWKDVQRLAKPPTQHWEEPLPKNLFLAKCGQCWKAMATTSVKGMDLLCTGCNDYDEYTAHIIQAASNRNKRM